MKVIICSKFFTTTTYNFKDGAMDADEEVSDEDIKKAQQELLEAKAAYQVRTNVIENVLIANPILNAVHAGKNASVVEK